MTQIAVNVSVLYESGTEINVRLVSSVKYYI